MIILHCTKEKNIWVSLFLGPKSMSAAQNRAQTGFARTATDKIFLIFLRRGTFSPGAGANGVCPPMMKGIHTEP
ncbi:MAG: hypothetical protein UC390_06295 [Peptococcaceae bacterium]|nr:hypothetical protein [Peptococcaceae bacterium]